MEPQRTIPGKLNPSLLARFETAEKPAVKPTLGPHVGLKPKTSRTDYSTESIAKTQSVVAARPPVLPDTSTKSLGVNAQTKSVAQLASRFEKQSLSSTNESIRVIAEPQKLNLANKGPATIDKPTELQDKGRVPNIQPKPDPPRVIFPKSHLDQPVQPPKPTLSASQAKMSETPSDQPALTFEARRKMFENMGSPKANPLQHNDALKTASRGGLVSKHQPRQVEDDKPHSVLVTTPKPNVQIILTNPEPPKLIGKLSERVVQTPLSSEALPHKPVENPPAPKISVISSRVELYDAPTVPVSKPQAVAPNPIKLFPSPPPQAPSKPMSKPLNMVNSKPLGPPAAPLHSANTQAPSTIGLGSHFGNKPQLPSPPKSEPTVAPTKVKDGQALLAGLFGSRPPAVRTAKPTESEISLLIETTQPIRPQVRRKGLAHNFSD